MDSPIAYRYMRFTVYLFHIGLTFIKIVKYHVPYHKVQQPLYLEVFCEVQGTDFTIQYERYC